MPDIAIWLVLSLAFPILVGGVLGARRAYQRARARRDQEFAQLERNLTLLLNHLLPPRGPHV